jgi:hypothetical protein
MRDRLAMTGDDDRFATLDLVQQFRESRLGVGRFDVFHDWTGQFDQSYLCLEDFSMR